jgi:hypothetical protein
VGLAKARGTASNFFSFLHGGGGCRPPPPVARGAVLFFVSSCRIQLKAYRLVPPACVQPPPYANPLLLVFSFRGAPLLQAPLLIPHQPRGGRPSPTSPYPLPPMGGGGQSRAEAGADARPQKSYQQHFICILFFSNLK